MRVEDDLGEKPVLFEEYIPPILEEHFFSMHTSEMKNFLSYKD